MLYLPIPDSQTFVYKPFLWFQYMLQFMLYVFQPSLETFGPEKGKVLSWNPPPCFRRQIQDGTSWIHRYCIIRNLAFILWSEVLANLDQIGLGWQVTCHTFVRSSFKRCCFFKLWLRRGVSGTCLAPLCWSRRSCPTHRRPRGRCISREISFPQCAPWQIAHYW